MKNHLQGMDQLENAKNSGAKLTPEEVTDVIDEFYADAERKGLETVAKEYGVSVLAKDLGEIARFKREYKVEFPEILEGAKIADTLRKFGAGMPEFEQFLSSVYSRSLEKGYTPNEIIAQSGKLESLEKRYGLTFDKLRDNYDETGKALAAKRKEIADLESDVVEIIKKKSDLMARYSTDELKIQEYAATKQDLANLGLEVAHLQGIRNFLVALKNSNFDPKEIITKLNSISDMQAQLSRIQKELSGTKRELDEKKVQLSEVQKLEEKYSKQKADIEAFNELRASGIDAKRMREWDQIIKTSNLDYGEIEGELRNQANLKALEDRMSSKIKNLLADELKLNQSITHLTQEKQDVELSIKTMKESALYEISAMSSNILTSLSTLNDQAQSKLQESALHSIKTLDEISGTTDQKIKQVAEGALSELKTTVTDLTTSTTNFSKELKSVIEQTSPEIKKVSSALEAGEKIGKFRNILPLLELMDGGAKADETEALIAMWNLTSRFNAWLENHYPKAKKDMSEPLGALLESINNEIQRIDSE